jgi:hypothetical protein
MQELLLYSSRTDGGIIWDYELMNNKYRNTLKRHQYLRNYVYTFVVLP